MSYFVLLNNYIAISVIASFLLFIFLYILLNLKNFNKKHFITIFICLICAIVSFCSLNIMFNCYNVKEISNSNFIGYVNKVNSNYILLKDIKVNNQKLNYNISMYLDDTSLIKEGNIISFESKLYPSKLVNDGEINLTMLTYSCSYKAYASSDNITIVDYKPKLSTKIKNYIFSNLQKFYSPKNTALVYAMLFGDKTFLSEFDTSSYFDVGLAHIFAVSGLHITLLIGAISFILRKLKVKNKVTFVLVLLFSIFYCYICNFSASVVRASVMSLCFLFALTLNKQPDNLNAFCIAFIVLTIINPINFLLKGFQLSFLCVFSILSLTTPLKNLLKFMPEKVASTFAVSISAMIGTSLTIISIYGTLNLLTALFNVLLIPIFSVIFVFIFATMILTSIIPIFSSINVIPNNFLNIYNKIVELFSKINSVVSLNYIGSTCLVLFILFIFVIGNFCILKKKPKLITSAIVLLFCVVSAIYYLLPANFSTTQLVSFRSKYDNCYLLTSSNNNRALVVNNLNAYSLSTLYSYLTRHNITRIDAIISNNVNLSDAEEDKLTSELSCKIISLNNANYISFIEYETIKIGSFNFSVTSFTAKKKCFVATIENNNLLFCFSALNLAEQEDLTLNYSNFIAVISRDKNYTNYDALKIVYNGDSEDKVISSKQQNFFTLIL